MEAFGLGPETTRFLDPPARLFSILDFKNSDDVNRWGDTAAVSTNLGSLFHRVSSTNPVLLVPPPAGYHGGNVCPYDDRN